MAPNTANFCKNVPNDKGADRAKNKARAVSLTVLNVSCGAALTVLNVGWWPTWTGIQQAIRGLHTTSAGFHVPQSRKRRAPASTRKKTPQASLSGHIHHRRNIRTLWSRPGLARKSLPHPRTCACTKRCSQLPSSTRVGLPIRGSGEQPNSLK